MSAGCLIGSMSTCLSFVAIGFGSLVGSGTLVTPLTHAPGQSRLPDSPAQIAPHSDPKGFAAELAYGVATYVANARECARTQRCLD